ncbi:hypothetical protein F4809DRAFT_639792 [Biscogniauxia mediterranea]|nr:hypothetical protein F4809DRAFT_639792 [Biscogniauxia mediterranea]
MVVATIAREGGLLSIGAVAKKYADQRGELLAITVGFHVSNISLHFAAFPKARTHKMFGYIFYKARKKLTRLLEKMLFSFAASMLPATRRRRATAPLGRSHSLACSQRGHGRGGHDTSVFFYLARDAAHYARLAHKIRSHGLERRGYQEWAAAGELPLPPPATATLSLGAGTLFGVNAYTLSHNAGVLPEPFSSKPERWLSPSGAGLETPPGIQEADAGCLCRLLYQVAKLREQAAGVSRNFHRHRLDVLVL